MLSVKEGWIKYHFLVFGMIRLVIGLQNSEPLANIPIIGLMSRAFPNGLGNRFSIQGRV